MGRFREPWHLWPAIRRAGDAGAPALAAHSSRAVCATNRMNQRVCVRLNPVGSRNLARLPFSGPKGQWPRWAGSIFLQDVAAQR